MKKLIILLVMLVVISPVLYAQEVDNVIGKKFSIASKVLAENRDIQIYLPEGYHSSKKKYPVLYILDGQRLFTLGVSLSQSLRSTVKVTPEFIVVGINNHYPDRFNNFTESDFLTFIEKELLPHVEQNYRATDERILFGWEYAGAYVIESLINKPTLFSGHIAASPYPIAETWVGEQSRVAQLESKLNSDLDSYLYFTVSEGENGVIGGTDKLNTLLTTKPSQSLRWTYRIIPDEEHLSTAHATMFQGVKNYFYGYQSFQISGLEQFNKAGGLKNFYAYNKLRAQRFGFAEQAEPWSMFTIVRNAIRADNFEQFDLFMNEFKSTDMIEKIKLSRGNLVAEYYLQNKQYQGAIEVYEIMAKANPENGRIQNELGDIYLSLKQKAIAKKHYQRAVELAKKSKDKRLNEFQQDLDNL
ncbi:MAG: alpha/beta hydrolase-fold protein [Colwellia sp.]|nr:alpha/beta hydrolase-fold protein [Colwellia sp.]